jgi:REP element-mobilizing transposase RayT
VPARRLSHFDYTSVGPYFVTICARERALLFVEPTVIEAVESCWNALAMHFPVELDGFVVMPNHIHGILWMRAGHARPLQVVVGAFKSATARRINCIRATPGAAVWQRGYYDHVIRNDADLKRIREYIASNPTRWDLDAENPTTRARLP